MPGAAPTLALTWTGTIAPVAALAESSETVTPWLAGTIEAEMAITPAPSDSDCTPLLAVAPGSTVRVNGSGAPHEKSVAGAGGGGAVRSGKTETAVERDAAHG